MKKIAALSLLIASSAAFAGTIGNPCPSADELRAYLNKDSSKIMIEDTAVSFHEKLFHSCLAYTYNTSYTESLPGEQVCSELNAGLSQALEKNLENWHCEKTSTGFAFNFDDGTEQ